VTTARRNIRGCQVRDLHTAEGGRHPNGLVWGMAIANYGHAGAWTESLGIIAPLQEMMPQNWDGSSAPRQGWPVVATQVLAVPTGFGRSLHAACREQESPRIHDD
jgi:hypothetical protein